MLYNPKLQLPIKQEWLQWDSEVQAVDLGREMSSHAGGHVRCRIRKAMGGEAWKIDVVVKHLGENAKAVRNRWLIWGFKAASQGRNCPGFSCCFFLCCCDFFVCLLVGLLVGGFFRKKTCKFFIEECPKAQSVGSEVYPRKEGFLHGVITAGEWPAVLSGRGGTTSPAYCCLLIRISCALWCVHVWGQEQKGLLLMVPSVS